MPIKISFKNFYKANYPSPYGDLELIFAGSKIYDSFYLVQEYVLFEMINKYIYLIGIYACTPEFSNALPQYKYITKFIDEFYKYKNYKKDCWNTFLETIKGFISKDCLDIIKKYYYT